MVTWGDPLSGGFSKHVEAQLSSGVKTVVANGHAFCAVKMDGSIVPGTVFMMGGRRKLIGKKRREGGRKEGGE